jgi:hypothetical protein
MTEFEAVTPLHTAIYSGPGFASPSERSSRDRVRSYRIRRKYGLVRRQVLLSSTQLDALETAGYLDPALRGTREDEAEALQTFVSDYLGA